MSEEYLEPNWDDGGRVHNWRNYVSPELRLIWNTFTLEQKRVLCDAFDELAGRENWA